MLLHAMRCQRAFAFTERALFMLAPLMLIDATKHIDAIDGHLQRRPVIDAHTRCRHITAARAMHNVDNNIDDMNTWRYYAAC